jgi:hypothetical protein
VLNDNGTQCDTCNNGFVNLLNKSECVAKVNGEVSEFCTQLSNDKTQCLQCIVGYTFTENKLKCS